MDWKNTEQFQDYTAGEAMCRAMAEHPERAAALDDEGCRRLIRSVIILAVQDYLHALRGIPFRVCAEEDRKSLEAFFLSGWCRHLFPVDGKRLIRLIRKEAAEE